MSTGSIYLFPQEHRIYRKVTAERSSDSDIENVSQQQIHCIFKTFNASSLHVVTAVNRHAECCSANIVSCTHSGVCIGSVVEKDLYMIVAARLFRIVDKTVGKLVIIGRSGILGAYADPIFICFVIGTDKPDIHCYIFRYTLRYICTAEAYFLSIREGKDCSVSGLQIVFLKINYITHQ